MAGVFLYVQHLLGSGHLHRVARIANALAALHVPVTLCSGGRPVRGLTLASGVRFEQLPPLHCAADDFTALLDHRGQPLNEDLRARRWQHIVDTLASAAPRVALIESFPFARRQMRFELLPLLERLRQDAVTTVCSVRDILQIKTKPGREQETLALLADYFAAVLVHADRRVVELRTTFKSADRIASEVHYTGYVAAPPADGDECDPDEAADIVVSAGGGAVGYPLFRAALDACRAGCQADKRWRFLLGSALQARHLAALETDVPVNAILTPTSENFAWLLQRCELSISQAGYNTVVDLLQAGCRGLVVPYTHGGEMEQALRAQLLHDSGLLASCNADISNVAEFAACVDDAIARLPARREHGIDLRGAQNTARLLQSWAGTPADDG